MIYVVLLVIGPFLGAFINWGIYTWAWSARAISPWTRPNEDAPPRKPTDRIPVVGWFGLRRESQSHLRRQREILRRYEPAGMRVDQVEPAPKIYPVFFWLRPMLIELAIGPLLVALYWWEVDQLGLISPEFVTALLPAAKLAIREWMTLMFAGHALLLVLLTIATFVDFDEQTIPDAVTIPGTLIGLTLAATGGWIAANPFPFCLPWTQLADPADISPTLFSSPRALAARWFSLWGLLVAEAVFAAWCFALSNRRWIDRRGFLKAVQYFWAGVFRHEMLLLGRFRMKVWAFLGCMWIVGSLLIAIVYATSPVAWIALVSAILGMGIGGGQIWAVRIVARVGLGKEAMGFGDVTLMAMIGAFLGWQASLFGFFLAPVTAIPIVLIAWLLTGNRVLPFGPYLAAASMLTVVYWDRIWNRWAAGLFVVGPLIGAVLALALLAMGGMLFSIRLAEQAILGRERR